MIKASRVKMNGLMIAAAAIIGTPAFAQNNGANEQQFSGQLESKSPVADRRHYQVRTINLEAGKRYAFSADSEDFDPKLRVSFADENDETLAEDDDGGEGNNAYLEFVPTRNGNHRIRVTAVNDSTGAYVLKMRAMRPLPPLARPVPVATSSIVMKQYAGEFTETDGEVRGRRVDDYLFRFEAGKQVFIYMDRENSDLDPVLEIYSEANRYSSDPLESDDDGGEGMNAFLSFIPKESGGYIVRATNAANERVNGRYRLRVGQEP